MPRSIDQSYLFAEDNIRIIDLIRIILPGQTILATNYESEIQDSIGDGSTLETYEIGTGYIAHGAIPLTSDTNPGQVEIIFDAIDNGANTVVRSFANGNYSGAPVYIYKKIATLDSADLVTLTSSFIVFSGIVDNFSIKVNNNEAQMSVVCSGPFANFDKNALYGYTAQQSQQILYPSDTGFQYAQETISNIKWEE